uniref:Uncharacterized protein n=1 Tax=Avena sativa TaxID=4498 RepID=A0ACD5XVY4_AVESA
MDPYKHLFYQSADAAIEAAAAADEAPAMEEGRRRRLQPLQLPHSQMNFAATDCGGILDTFAIFRPRCGEEEEGRIVYFSKFGEAGLYDGDKHLHHTLGVLNAPKGIRPMCLSMAPHPATNQDSMYVLNWCPGKDNGRCFEVLEPLPNPTQLSSNMVTPNWRWRLLPPPPFISQPGYIPTPITAYTTAVNGSNGCSTIYVSFNGGIGTYRFEAARPDPSSHLGWSPLEKWGYVGAWRLPFHGRAQYVSEFNLWFGFSEFSPSQLCAVDLSAIALGEGGPPTVLEVGQDLNLPDKEHWIPVHLELVNLGDGKFLIARIFEIEATSEQFAVLTGIEMLAGAADDQSLKVVKHKCARYDFGDDSINWVL